MKYHTRTVHCWTPGASIMKYTCYHAYSFCFKIFWTLQVKVILTNTLMTSHFPPPQRNSNTQLLTFCLIVPCCLISCSSEILPLRILLVLCSVIRQNKKKSIYKIFIPMAMKVIWIEFYEMFYNFFHCDYRTFKMIFYQKYFRKYLSGISHSYSNLFIFTLAATK